ncbi:DUF3376 domain-containing protein [Geodermatophilus marinus]|uniref:DUF3376 domain-containing protein n=1 Tax=Geodermatophilus sp. LHW52908 TaxID=2303986 RepID=UPI000E3B7E13|nr:DUF3376 domain-containing protein [Geodermatophilus sp. LHW52908]RFU21663.1 DUF3376 domain-containing protein [Geodermatophilus sp. LHW52908]
MTEAGQRRRELRVAVVLNGGVSLAVWMGGVTHELDLLRRASRVAAGAAEEDVGGVAGHDRAVFDAWVDLCRGSDVGEVVVDVIAGTSAGGLNGTLLAAAVARGVPLDPPGGGPRPRLRDIWDTSARLEPGALLRGEDVQPALASVLDGDFFRREIEQVVTGIDGSGRPGRRDPVTLFVTATALGRSDRDHRDSFSRRFAVADHRRLYRFRRTEDERVGYAPGDGPPATWWRGGDAGPLVDDFAPADPSAAKALVTAARASASFPLAFTPVQEGPDLAHRRVLPASTLEPDGGRWLVDGGILDNAPFQPVLDAIARRPATEPVRRLLVYVVPSRGAEPPSLDDAAPGGAAGAEHPAWPAILGAAVGFPREGDVRADMEYAAELLGAGEATDVRPEVGPEALFREEVDGPTHAADGLFEQYRRARAVGGLQDVRETLARARADSAVVLAPSAGVRPAELCARDLPWAPPPDPDAAFAPGPWRWGLGTAERVCRLLVRDLWDRDDVEPAAIRDVDAALLRVEAVRDAVAARLAADAASAPEDALGLVDWAAARIAGLRVQEALTHCLSAASAAYAAARRGAVADDTARRAGLVVEVATQAFTAHHRFQRTAQFEFLRLGPDVESPLADTTPEAQAAARACGDDKLYGTRLRHFAAFGLPGWRAWDWTAGRLDAQAHLARAVRGGDVAAWTAAVQARTVRAELGLSPGEWADRRDRLHRTTDGDLLADLREDEHGRDLVAAVADAVMRALPQPLALDRPGAVVNALLARRPLRWWFLPWAPVLRLPARIVWRHRVAGVGRRSPDGRAVVRGDRR